MECWKERDEATTKDILVEVQLAYEESRALG